MGVLCLPRRDHEETFSGLGCEKRKGKKEES